MDIDGHIPTPKLPVARELGHSNKGNVVVLPFSVYYKQRLHLDYQNHDT